LDQKNENV
jgi:tetratricopeptide (TPR) repeat protein